MSSVDALAQDMPAQLAVAPPQSDWCDVTELFSTAAKELKVGQLIHVESFNLFDSMSALELMDPKMDAGLLLPSGASAPPLSVAERIQKGAIPLVFTSARDVLATVDELFRAEASWLHGQPLPQTLLTCVYVHRDAIAALLARLLPATAEQGDGDSGDNGDEAAAAAHATAQQQLHALGGSLSDTLLLVMATLCAFTLRTCSQVREIVVRADIYEEEDFSPGSAGGGSALSDAVDLDVWTPSVLETLLMAAVQRMETLLVQERARASSSSSSSSSSSKKSGKKKGGAKTTAHAHMTSSSSRAEAATTTAAPSVKLESLHGNAKISALLCEALLRRLQLRKVLHVVYAEIGLAEKVVDLEMARVSFSSAEKLLQQISAEELEFDVECFSGKPVGFDKTLTRLLMSGSPPREIKPLKMDQAVEIYTKMVQDLVVACSPRGWTTMEQVRIFLSDFSKRKATIIARSLVLLLLYCDKKIYGKHSFMDWMTDEMVQNGVPSVLLSTQEGVQFSSRAIETLYESLKVYLHNRSRQRARIELLLEEWAVLQLDAVAVDERFMVEMQIAKAAYPRYFTAWSLEQVTVLMVQYVLLGFELELYAQSEFSTIFWYLDYLCGSRLQNLNFTWSFLERMKELMKNQPRRGGGGGAAVPSATPAVDAAKARFQCEISYTEMTRSMMRAYFQLFAAFERDALVAAAPPAYGTRAIRFQHRFAAFQSLQFPAMLTYEDYVKNSDFTQYGVDLIYKSAEECFKVARTHGDEISASGAQSDGAEEAVQSVVLWRREEAQAVVNVAMANLVHMARREQEREQRDHQQQQQQKSSRRGGGKAVAASQQQQSGSLCQDHKKTAVVVVDFGTHPHFPVLTVGSPGPSTSTSTSSSERR